MPEHTPDWYRYEHAAIEAKRRQMWRNIGEIAIDAVLLGVFLYALVQM